MTLIAMDTFEVVKELKAAGFTEEQAEAMGGMVRQAFPIGVSTLATKADLAAAKSALQLQLAEMKVELLKWLVVGAMGGQAVVLIGFTIAVVRSVGHR